MNGRIDVFLGGETRSLWFNNYAKAALGAVYGLDPLEAGEKMMTVMKENYMKAIAELVYSGLEGWHYATDTPKQFTQKDIKLWCADADMDEMVGVFNTWLDASKLRDLIKTDKPDKEEKKRPGKKSSISPSVN